jgi:methyl-accepting chemotaxis protein
LTNLNRKMRRRVAAAGGLQGKLGQILEVGEKLTQVGSKVNEVNGQLGLLDKLLQEVNATRNFAAQAIEDLQRMAVEQARLRFVMSKLAVLSGISAEQWQIEEERFRGEFDALSKDVPA